jgi:short-subunit dehydrogenase
LAKKVSAVVGKRGLNVLINNVGILSMASKTEPFYTGEMAEVYATNVIAPAKLTKALLPLLKAAGASGSDDFHIQHALVVNFSSVYGSISQASTALYLPYRCSKVYFTFYFR